MALREQRSGQNDDDVMKAALDIFYNARALTLTWNMRGGSLGMM